jgi:hypothetical protein
MIRAEAGMGGLYRSANPTAGDTWGRKVSEQATARSGDKQEPVIHSQPEMGGPNFTFPTGRHYAANFVYVGRRTTGSNAGHFTLSDGAGPVTCPTA